MAKKKTSSSTTRKAKKKTPTTKKKASAKKPASTKKPAAPATSVDAVLEKYEKERSSKETLLTRSRKEIEELGNKVISMQEKIATLKETVATTEVELGQIDARRATDVSSVLAKLGVNLTDVPAEPESPQRELEFGSGINDDDDDRDTID